jgi:calcineurin-like phosphoesterase family protein
VTRFWTSDLHLGHKNIIAYCHRPWASTDLMNEGLIQRWNDVVSSEDEVMVLGDVALGPIRDSLALVRHLNGRKLLVAGNHDRCWVGNPKAERWREAYEDAGFEILSDGPWLDVQLTSEQTVRVSHFPYEDASRHERKYLPHLPPDDGLWLLHGHVHTDWAVSGRQFNVGVDANSYAPVSDEQVLATIRAARHGS